MNLWIVYINWLVNMINNVNFINKFLSPKYKDSFKRSIVINSMFVTVNYFLFYKDYFSKIIFFIIGWSVLIVFNYYSTFFEKALTIILVMAGNVFSEIPLITILPLLFGAEDLTNFNTVESVIVYIISNVLIYITFWIILKVFNSIDFKIKVYARLILAITIEVTSIIYFVTFSIIFTKSFTIEQSINIRQSLMVVIMVVIINIFVSIYILRMNKKFYFELYEKKIISKKYQLQAKQLQEYQLLRDNETRLRQVRHDIINYLQVREKL